MHQVVLVHLVALVYQGHLVYLVYLVYLKDGATGYAFGVMEADAVGENARSHQIECGQRRYSCSQESNCLGAMRLDAFEPDVSN